MGHETIRRERPVVLTVTTPGYSQQWRFCLDSQAEYCSKHGFEHRIFDVSESSYHPTWAKLKLATEAIEEGRDVMSIDADAEIDSNCPPFTDLLKVSPTRDIFYALGISRRPNAGMLIFRGKPKSVALDFMRECWTRRGEKVPPEDFVTPDGENGHVIWILKEEPYKTASIEIDRAWNWSIPENADRAFIRHYTNHLRAFIEANPRKRCAVISN